MARAYAIRQPFKMFTLLRTRRQDDIRHAELLDPGSWIIPDLPDQLAPVRPLSAGDGLRALGEGLPAQRAGRAIDLAGGLGATRALEEEVEHQALVKLTVGRLRAELDQPAREGIHVAPGCGEELVFGIARDDRARRDG